MTRFVSEGERRGSRCNSKKMLSEREPIAQKNEGIGIEGVSGRGGKPVWEPKVGKIAS